MTITDKRRALDLSLGECARASGLTSRELSDIEWGRKAPTDAQVESLAVKLGWTTEELREALPCPEDIEREAKRASNFIDAVSAVTASARENGLRRGNGGRGETKCPACGGRLAYSVAGSNGHVMAACSTEGCVRWIQ